MRTTIEGGDGFQAKFGRSGFRMNFTDAGVWQGRSYSTKQLEVYAVQEGDGWLVITVLVKYV